MIHIEPMSSYQETLVSMEALDAAGRREVCAAYVARVREDTARGFARMEDPGALVADLARAFDALLQALYRAARIPSAARISLIALGGYGRGELFPHSDLDLLLLYDGEDETLTSRLVEATLYPLWDARVSVGHAVRTQEDALDLAAGDLTMRTSLLDARWVCGDEGPYHALGAAALRRFFGPDVARFVADLREEQSRRHQRFGETVFLLEPNIKLSKGGLRDLNIGLWAAKARLGISDLQELQAAGGALPRQVRALEEARTFFRWLRLAMHLHAGRAQDQLTFELQEALAPSLFAVEEVPGLRPHPPHAVVEQAVERMMHAFYRHARAVVVETDGLLQRLEHLDAGTVPAGIPATDRADEHLVLTGRRIRSMQPERFWNEPAELLRAFSVSLDLSCPLDRPTRDVMAEAAAGAPGARLPADERAAEIFLELLTNPEPGRESSILEEMHDLGLLAALIPELGPCTGRIQHDLYHVYTVDLHSLYVVAWLKARCRDPAPEGTEDEPGHYSALMQALQDHEGLFVAALLHDVAKPLGSGHAARGARLAAGVVARLGLPWQRQETVRFLVEQHLLMAHISQRRDLSDPAVIAAFARIVGSVDRLRQLYLLTVADTAMTAPENLTGWKASLLEELYWQTYRQLTLGESLAGDTLEQEIITRRDRLELLLRRRWGEAGTALARRLPDPMLLSQTPEELGHVLQAALELETSPATTLRVLWRRRSGSTTELTVCCADSPGLLATIAGIMVAHRVEVLEAQVTTLEPSGALAAAGRPALALDVFIVRTQAPDSDHDELWPALVRDLERALTGELSVPELVQRHTRPSVLRSRVLPRVRIRVTVDNEVSERLTVVEVQAPDRLGVLYCITRTLSELGLAIHISKVATEAGRVMDVFYVSDGRSGGKVTDEALLQAVREQVVSALQKLEGGARSVHR